MTQLGAILILELIPFIPILFVTTMSLHKVEVLHESTERCWSSHPLHEFRIAASGLNTPYYHTQILNQKLLIDHWKSYSVNKCI